MATQSQGIQQLLAAERRAAEKTAEARKRKNRRMKQAKDEAMVEIEKYKSEREAAYKEKEAKQLGSKEGIQAKIEEYFQACRKQMHTADKGCAFHNWHHVADVTQCLYTVLLKKASLHMHSHTHTHS